jgi:hypothetical protein
VSQLPVFEVHDFRDAEGKIVLSLRILNPTFVGVLAVEWCVFLSWVMYRGWKARRLSLRTLLLLLAILGMFLEEIHARFGDT